MDREKLGECARAFMDAYAKPEWQELSLDEWILEYGEQLPERAKIAGNAILRLFPEYGGDAI